MSENNTETSTTTTIVKAEENKPSVATAKTLNELPLADTAKALMTSGLIRKEDDIGKVFAKLSLGRDLNLPAVTSINGIHIGPNSSIILSAAVMRLLINRSGRYKIRVNQRDTKGASIEAFEKMPDGTWESMGVPITFTNEDAKRAGLDGRETYKKWPADMYYARCLAAIFRTYTPDCAAGCAVYLPEEIDGSGFKTDPVSGDAVPDADYEVKVKRPPKRTASNELFDKVKKLMVDTKSDVNAFLNFYEADSLEKLTSDQLVDLEQKLSQKKAAMKC